MASATEELTLKFYLIFEWTLRGPLRMIAKSYPSNEWEEEVLKMGELDECKELPGTTILDNIDLESWVEYMKSEMPIR